MAGPAAGIRRCAATVCTGWAAERAAGAWLQDPQHSLAALAAYGAVGSTLTHALHIVTSRRRRSARSSSLAGNLRWGLGWGWGFAALLCALVLVQADAQGGLVVRGVRLSLIEVMLANLLAGTGAGLLVGLCRPLLGTIASGMLVGPAAGVVVYAAGSLAASGWQRVNWGFALGAGVLSGLVAGTYFG
jgi:hypothetical protein